MSALARFDQSLVAYDREAVHHYRLARQAVERALEDLAARPAAQRAGLPGIEEGRAELIVGGALVLATLMEHFGFEECLVSESDILDGMVATMREQAGGPNSVAPPSDRPSRAPVTLPSMSWGHTTVYPELRGRRVLLRPLVVSDFDAWREVRERSRNWLVKWEPRQVPGQPDPAQDKRAFAARCNARLRERELGTGYGFGVFIGNRFAGEINISSVQRGPFQNAYVGYWVDEAMAGTVTRLRRSSWWPGSLSKTSCSTGSKCR